jgi:hypothetical protein
VADGLFEEGAEGADALKAYLSAGLGHCERFSCEAFAGLFDPFAGEVLVRGESVDAGKRSVKMKGA